MTNPLISTVLNLKNFVHFFRKLMAISRKRDLLSIHITRLSNCDMLWRVGIYLLVIAILVLILGKHVGEMVCL